MQVSLEYLSGLHNKHEEWLAHPESLVRAIRFLCCVFRGRPVVSLCECAHASPCSGYPLAQDIKYASGPVVQHSKLLLCVLPPQWMPGQQGVLPGRNMGPLSPADFSIDLLNDNALQLPAAHAGSLALPELPPLIKDKARPF